MKYLDLTLPAPPANLACDEALLDACETEGGPEVLRFWEPSDYFVVVGYANHTAREVHLEACREENVGVYRRGSGGGTVLQGPGCLNYSLILKIEGNPSLHTITAANGHIMERHRQAVAGILGKAVAVAGITDLSLNGAKFSGNAQRRKRRALVFHGTFLLHFDLARLQKFLPMPSRQPDYRQNRPHDLFLTNLNVSSSAIKTALRAAWGATETFAGAPRIPPSLEEKYASDAWNLKF